MYKVQDIQKLKLLFNRDICNELNSRNTNPNTHLRVVHDTPSGPLCKCVINLSSYLNINANWSICRKIKYIQHNEQSAIYI